MKKRLLKHSLIASAFLLYAGSLQAQNTYDGVYHLFQTKCVSCHGGATPAGGLDLSGTANAVYAAIVNHTPVNTTAATRGDKTVKPGYTHSSFLLRKINNGLDPDNGLKAGEGASCPQTGTISNQNIELVRQWINMGAPQTGNVIDTNMINKFYSGRGYSSAPASHPLPTDPGSYQMHIGKVFLDSSSEVEYFQKFDLGLPDTLEVNRIELFMGSYSHHFILYKFTSPAAATNFAEGLRVQNPTTGMGSSTGYTTIVSAWQRPYNFQLPATTAYSWPTGTVLDLNHHFFNFNPDSVMSIDIYLNIYTQPKHTCQNIMYSSLYSNQNIFIPNNATDIMFTQNKTIPTSGNMWNVWLMSSHTHKYGVNFDIFQRNTDGTTGTKLYDGKMNYTTNTNTGVFDWSHPPVEVFTPMVVINPRDGFVAQATYNNNGPAPVQFGLTTKAEMMVWYIQYTLGASLTTGIQEDLAKQLNLSVYPNPSAGASTLHYTLGESSKVKIDVYNLMGQHLKTLADEQQGSGDHSYLIEKLAAGTYLLKTQVNGASVTTRVVTTN
jgi:hypothetical protein